jgi:Kdo2-lipid IVA lauroyltransferase/acyltransferase
MYYLIYGFLYLLSLLPMWILYGISDLLYALIFYVFGYRKTVVLQNLAIAFPDKSQQERVLIAKKFYRNFIDTFIETIKLFSASEEFMRKRFAVNLDIFDQLHRSGKKVQVHLGHNFNWELASLAVCSVSPFVFLAVYMPIENKAIDRVFKKLRGRTGAIFIPATNMRNSLFPYRHEQYLLALVADQVPGNMSKAYWLNFFGRPTPFVQGPERGAMAGNIPVVFASISKVKRGFYSCSFLLATENPANMEQGQLTRMYRDYLEEVICKSPEMWLWSHRRWKREWKPEYASKWIDNVPAPAVSSVPGFP